MTISIAKRLELVAATQLRIFEQLSRLNAEIESIQRELGLDKPKRKA